MTKATPLPKKVSIPKMLRAVDVDLLVRAASALIEWRYEWERKYEEPPTADNGQADEQEIWGLAGELMDAAGERVCQHEDCERKAVAECNGSVFCDEHVRERLRTTADDNLRKRVRELESLLRELVDIEGPQPGHVMWYRKVQNALGLTSDAEAPR